MRSTDTRCLAKRLRSLRAPGFFAVRHAKRREVAIYIPGASFEHCFVLEVLWCSNMFFCSFMFFCSRHLGPHISNTIPQLCLSYAIKLSCILCCYLPTGYHRPPQPTAACTSCFPLPSSNPFARISGIWDQLNSNLAHPVPFSSVPK